MQGVRPGASSTLRSTWPTRGSTTGSTTARPRRLLRGRREPGTSRVAYVQNGTEDSDGGRLQRPRHERRLGGRRVRRGRRVAAQDALGFKYGMGAAPRAELGVTKIFNCANTLDLPAGGFTSLAAQAYAGGARISNHSWGNQDLGRYSADSREFDFLVRDAAARVRPQRGDGRGVRGREPGRRRPGAANEGWASIASPGPPRTSSRSAPPRSHVRWVQITCGIDDGGANQSRDIIDFSSRGPTNDGRLKPDLVAPGTQDRGRRAADGRLLPGLRRLHEVLRGPLYSLESGTSQAAPAVSGAAALIRQWFDDEQGALRRRPLMTKAILVGSAADLAGGETGRATSSPPRPTPTRAGAVRTSAGHSTTRSATTSIRTSCWARAGSDFARAYDVQDPSTPLKVTLAWTDAPGAVDANPTLVNDLDLVVQAGRPHLQGQRVRRGALDHGRRRRPAEQPGERGAAAATGSFSVEVLGTNVAGDGVPGAGTRPIRTSHSSSRTRRRSRARCWLPKKSNSTPGPQTMTTAARAE